MVGKPTSLPLRVCQDRDCVETGYENITVVGEACLAHNVFGQLAGECRL